MLSREAQVLFKKRKIKAIVNSIENDIEEFAYEESFDYRNIR